MPYSFYMALDSLATHGDTNPSQRHKHRRNIRWKPAGYEVSSALGVSPIIKGQRPLSTQKWPAIWLTHGRCHAPDTGPAGARLREYSPVTYPCRRRVIGVFAPPVCWISMRTPWSNSPWHCTPDGPNRRERAASSQNHPCAIYGIFDSRMRHFYNGEYH
jgi:hypothetical protein